MEDILDEIRLRHRQGYRVIDFEDDNLTFFKNEMKELCRRLIKEFSDLEFTAMNGISYLSLDPELLELMRRAGFTRLNLALVSSDKSVLETSRRPHTIGKYQSIVAEAHRLGFQITSYQILGLPFETLESMIETLALAARAPVLLGASMFYRTPASPIAAKCAPPAGADAHFLSRLTAMAIGSEHFQRGDIYTLFICTRIFNFLKGLPSMASTDPRRRLGLELLARLNHEGVLYGSTPAGLRPLPEFRVDLYRRVCSATGWLCATDGSRVELRSQVSYCSTIPG